MSFFLRSFLLLFLLTFFFLPVPVEAGKALKQPPNQETTELWSGKVYSSSYRLGMCFAPSGKVRGVFVLHRADGETDVYHFNGFLNGTVATLKHPSGHTLIADLEEDNPVDGFIILKNGMKIKLKGKREKGVSLDPNDCAPLN